MTVIPSDAHCARRASKSNMFVWAKYSTGRTPRAAPAAKTASAGDGFCLPAANQFSLSAIQKSGSLCTAITSRSVNISPFSTVNSVPFANRYSVIGLISSSIVADCCAGAVGASSSKFISEKTGANVGAPPNSGVSKSWGRGSSPAGCNSGIASGVWCAVGASAFDGSNADF